MGRDDDVAHREGFVDLLTGDPSRAAAEWAESLVLRCLESSGREPRCQSGRTGSEPAARAARRALAAAVRTLQGADRAFAVRVFLLVPWEMLCRTTGLRIHAPQVVDVLVSAAGDEEWASAARDVVERGPAAVKDFPRGGLLAGRRGTGEGLVFTLGPADRRLLGTSARCIVIDPVERAVVGFHPYRWEANLRAIVPAWLEGLAPAERDGAARELLRQDRENNAEDRARYRLMGLLDWLCRHREQAAAEEALGRGLQGRTGDVRKAALALAAAMGRVDVLERMAWSDPDKGVRRRAMELAAPSTGQPARSLRVAPTPAEPGGLLPYVIVLDDES